MIAKVFTFLEKLKLNNNRDWFNQNKHLYDEARLEFSTLLGQIISGIATFDSEAGLNQPDKCIFRIYRDVRFSHNKLPYKTNMGAYIAAGGRKTEKAGYYIHLDPEGSFLGAGIYSPEAKTLQAIRQEIYFNPKPFISIVEDPGFLERFGQLIDEKLVRPPKGFSPEFQHIEMLKYKHYVAAVDLTKDKLYSTDLVHFTIDSFRTASPLVHFLNHAIDMTE
jgi:uncharacterized protein (TIGR02453 family)